MVCLHNSQSDVGPLRQETDIHWLLFTWAAVSLFRKSNQAKAFLCPFCVHSYKFRLSLQSVRLMHQLQDNIMHEQDNGTINTLVHYQSAGFYTHTRRKSFCCTMP